MHSIIENSLQWRRAYWALLRDILTSSFYQLNLSSLRSIRYIDLKFLLQFTKLQLSFSHLWSHCLAVRARWRTAGVHWIFHSRVPWNKSVFYVIRSIESCSFVIPSIKLLFWIFLFPIRSVWWPNCAIGLLDKVPEEESSEI